jgi:hypothetical protein
VYKGALAEPPYLPLPGIRGGHPIKIGVCEPCEEIALGFHATPQHNPRILETAAMAWINNGDGHLCGPGGPSADSTEPTGRVLREKNRATSLSPSFTEGPRLLLQRRNAGRDVQRAVHQRDTDGHATRDELRRGYRTVANLVEEVDPDRVPPTTKSARVAYTKASLRVRIARGKKSKVRASNLQCWPSCRSPPEFGTAKQKLAINDITCPRTPQDCGTKIRFPMTGRRTNGKA